MIPGVPAVWLKPYGRNGRISMRRKSIYACLILLAGGLCACATQQTVQSTAAASQAAECEKWIQAGRGGDAVSQLNAGIATSRDNWASLTMSRRKNGTAVPRCRETWMRKPTWDISTVTAWVSNRISAGHATGTKRRRPKAKITLRMTSACCTSTGNQFRKITPPLPPTFRRPLNSTMSTLK